jgi:NAD+ synthase
MNNEMKIDTKKVENILVDFIRNTVHNAGYSKAVIGLSGGVDSSLACYLTVKALGAENVLGVLMPYATSSIESISYAYKVVQELQINSEMIAITEMVDSFVKNFGDMSPIRKGNIMARCRMITLYDLSAKYNSLVIGTGNKTEEILGYTTLYGDSACALNPLADLYKTQVYQLAKEVGGRAPSADLWNGQTDESELGFTYEQIDSLLFYMLDKNCTREECIKAGFRKDFVDDIIYRKQKMHFKNVMPPIGYIFK